MKNLIIGMLLAVSCFIHAAVVHAETANTEMWVISGATIIDGSGNKPIKNGVIVIENDRIVSVGKKGNINIPENAQKINAKGKYIIPGLMDANVHLVAGAYLENLVRYEDRIEERIEEAAQISLKYGLTTVFDSWGPRQPLVNVRNRINAGEIPGSRFYLAGNIVGMGGPMTTDFLGGTEAPFASKRFLARTNQLWEQGVGPELLSMTPQQVREKVKIYTKKDIDFVKFLVSGHGSPQGNMLAFSPTAAQAIIDETKNAGLTIQTHTTTVESLRLAVEHGVDIMQHCDATGPTAIPDSTIQLMAQKKIYCAILSLGLTTKKRAQYLSKMGYDDAANPLRKISEGNIQKIIKGGVPILLGTDAGVYEDGDGTNPKYKSLVENTEDNGVILGEAHFTWLQAMVERGMKPMDALLAATSSIAKAYKVDKDLGSLAPGKIADLVILDKNPLDDPQHYRRIHLIMKGGIVIDREALPLNPLMTKAANAR